MHSKLFLIKIFKGFSHCFTFQQSARNTIECWLVVQAAWLYLEPIFGSEDIRNQIPVEGGKFTQVLIIL